jgi:hypothetical protein
MQEGHAKTAREDKLFKELHIQFGRENRVLLTTSSTQA